MLLATALLSAALVPAPATTDPVTTQEPTPVPEAPAAPTGLEGFDDSTEPAPPEPSVPQEPAPSMGLEVTEAPSSPPPSAQEHIDAGLKAFVRGRFSRARDEFAKAYEAAPESAATAFYLGYACYKIGEPSLRMNADKQRARELFAKAYRLDPAFEPVWGQKAPPAQPKE